MISAGGQGAFEDRWREAEEGLRRALDHRMGNRADVDDALQDAALVAWLKRDCYDPGRSFAAWIYGIARRCRSRGGQARMVALVPDHDLVVEAAYDAEAENLQFGLASLEPGEAELLRLRHAEGLGIASLAGRFAVAPRTVHRRLRQAEERLRRIVLAGS